MLSEDEKDRLSLPLTHDQPRYILAPYVSTPQDVVERMLQLAEVTSRDLVYDLGCGDGRIVITAAKKYGARGVGIDIEPYWVAESQSKAKQGGVEHLVTFSLQDAMTVDLSPATVVTLFGPLVNIKAPADHKKTGQSWYAHSFSQFRRG